MTSGNESPGLFDATGSPIARMPDAVRPATNGVIFNESGEVLIQKRADNGWWSLPGGVMEIGESVEQCAIREVLEETGLHVTVKRLIGIYSDPKYHCIMTYPGGAIILYVTAVFECERQSGELAISEESTDIGYFPVEGLPENTLISSQIRIEDAVTNRIEPFIK